MRIRAKVYHEPWGPDGWSGKPWLFDVFDEEGRVRMDGAYHLLDWGSADSQAEAFQRAFEVVGTMRFIAAQL